MNLDRETELAALPIKIVRDAIREMNRHDNNDTGWRVESLAAHLKISATHASWLCETLREQGVLERKPQPDTRWHKPGTYYTVSDAGTRFTNASMLKRIDRARVDRLLASLLERVNEINGNDDLCCFINEIRLFGSAIDREAESFADVDVCYVLARRKKPPQYKRWTDWSIARAEQSGRQSLPYLSELFFGETEVKRMLKGGSPYISLHTLDDVVGIGADSVRLYVAPDGAIEEEGDGVSGETLSRAAMKAATESAQKRDETRSDKKLRGAPTPIVPDESPEDRMISAIQSLAFDILRAIDELAPPGALEHSIKVAHECIKTYRAAGERLPVPDILRDALSIDFIEKKKASEKEEFVFSGDREREAQDGTNDKAAAEKGMKHAVIAQLKCTLTAQHDPDVERGVIRQFEAYSRAAYDQWKYRQNHPYDWQGPESLSDRAVLTIRRIANRTGEKLDKQAVKVLADRGFIKPFRKTDWRLTAKGEVAIKYHEECAAWNKQRTARPDAPLSP